MPLGLGLSSGKDNAPWTPAHLPGLLHWYRKGIGVEADGEADVTRWTSQSSSLHAEQDGATNNSPNLLSDNTIAFHHASNFLEFKDGGSATNIVLGAFSLYFKLNFGPSDTIGAEDLIESDGNNFFKLTSPTTARYKIGGNRHDFTFDEIVEGVPFVIAGERDSDGNMSVWLNNSQAVADDGEGTEAISTNLTLSQFGKPTNNSFWSEVVICNASLTAGERNNLHTYLSNL